MAFVHACVALANACAVIVVRHSVALGNACAVIVVRHSVALALEYCVALTEKHRVSFQNAAFHLEKLDL